MHKERETDAKPLTEQEKADIAKKLLAKAKSSGKDYALMPVQLRTTSGCRRFITPAAARRSP
ncbi:hypothetical protein J31TS3_58160 [Paenibacillus lactis]|nr:hypothetical protein J31TS3_58160 [Paenibacillus lactis]